MSTHWNASLHLGGSGAWFNCTIVPLVSKANGDGITFNLMHAECEGRIKKLDYCPHCDKVLSPEEITKGYAYQKGSYLLVSNEEIASATPERSPEIVLDKFVPYTTVLPDFYDKGYWLAPSELPTQQRYYTVTWRALAGVKQIGLGFTTFTGKEHPCAVVANESGLRMYTLLDPAALTRADWSLSPVSKTDLQTAQKAILDLSGSLEHEDLVTTQSSNLRELIDAKLAGIEYSPPAELEAAPAPDFMEILREQVAINTKPKRKVAAR